jgi:hypothetical protein
VAYGIGGPVLFVTQDSISLKIAQSGQAKEIVYGFLLGVVFQVLLSLINKWNNWNIYIFSETKQKMGKRRFKISEWISHQSWIDISDYV